MSIRYVDDFDGEDIPDGPGDRFWTIERYLDENLNNPVTHYRTISNAIADLVRYYSVDEKRNHPMSIRSMWFTGDKQPALERMNGIIRRMSSLSLIGSDRSRCASCDNTFLKSGGAYHSLEWHRE